MVLEQGTFRASDTARTRAYPKELEGFLLSRQVEGCSPATCKTYELRLTQFFRIAGNGNVQGMDRSHVEKYLLYLQALKRSPHYLDGNFRALRTFFNWCLDEEFITRSPMRNMKPPRLPKKGKPFLSEAGRDALLSVCPPARFCGARNGAMVWVFWTTGMRRAELAGLTIGDLNWDNSSIRVFGKGSKERYVPFTKEAKKAVWRYLSHRRDNLPQLWLTEERLPLTMWGVSITMRHLMQRAGVRVKDACHVFRRSWAMRNIKAGIPTKFVQLIGGWSSLNMLDDYVRAMTSEDALGAHWV